MGHDSGVVLEDRLEGHAEAAHNLRRHLRRHRLLVDEQGWTRSLLLLGLPLRLLGEDVGDGVIRNKNFTTKLPRTTLGTGLARETRTSHTTTVRV